METKSKKLSFTEQQLAAHKYLVDLGIDIIMDHKIHYCSSWHNGISINELPNRNLYRAIDMNDEVILEFSIPDTWVPRN
jgi:hypothetical protein